MQVFAVDAYNAWWQKGNDFYGKKEFDSAAFYYEKLTVLNPLDAVVYYNLGNTYYRLNKIGPAVLYYEKALRLDPGYTDAKDNLSLTQSRIANRVPNVPDIFFVSWWKTLTEPGKATAWAIICLVLFLSVLGILLMKRFGRISHVSPQLIGFISFGWIIFLILSIYAAANANDSNSAVVMQNNAPLLNVIQGKTQSLVPEGTTVQLTDIKGNWVEIRLPDGRRGWMQQSLLSKI